MIISQSVVYYMLFISLPTIIHIDTFKTEAECEKFRQELKVKLHRHTQVECVQVKINKGETK